MKLETEERLNRVKERKEKIEKFYNELYEKFEADYYISSFKEKDEVIQKMKELNGDERLIAEWIESEKLNELYEKYEADYYISSFKYKDEVIQKMKELNCDEKQITEWIESIM